MGKEREKSKQETELEARIREIESSLAAQPAFKLSAPLRLCGL